MLRKTREISALATEGTGEEAVELETRFLLRTLKRRRFLGRARHTGVMGSVWNPSAYRPGEPCRLL